MNQVLGKLKKDSCTDNPHPDNREYTVYVHSRPRMNDYEPRLANSIHKRLYAQTNLKAVVITTHWYVAQRRLGHIAF
jgi:hypothetical protein